MIKEITRQDDLKQALKLVNDVFSEFVAVDYSQEGRLTFENYLTNKYDEVSADLKTGHKKMWGYYADNSTVVGVIATRDISHISLLFVDKRYHVKGIATQLFHTVIEQIDSSHVDTITVNSSPYAVDIYKRLGFKATGDRQENDGIIFIPMSCSLPPRQNIIDPAI